MRLKIVAIALLLIAGCSSPGEFVARQAGESAPRMGTAPQDGTYGLFIAGEGSQLYDLPLKQGDPLGFEWVDEGNVKWMYAVAGNSRNRLDVQKTYEWRRLP